MNHVREKGSFWQQQQLYDNLQPKQQQTKSTSRFLYREIGASECECCSSTV